MNPFNKTEKSIKKVGNGRTSVKRTRTEALGNDPSMLSDVSSKRRHQTNKTEYLLQNEIFVVREQIKKKSKKKVESSDEKSKDKETLPIICEGLHEIETGNGRKVVAKFDQNEWKLQTVSVEEINPNDLRFFHVIIYQQLICVFPKQTNKQGKTYSEQAQSLFTFVSW
ncbi:hypothetical protein RFI_00548 [Reticulomyxa filosa]|uniref:Uncharacterized protein n=1 Tax=Reticulomyxa filosa TaxID=46433 RepID=X6PDF1_RETFI|nr:hypothetical protein RFI_00548 [Reticulomyxa filosa]|eukprot:ETO36515.1 hypothetical protein RFI_00548 [Reticulomyxa filosa]